MGKYVHVLKSVYICVKKQGQRGECIARGKKNEKIHGKIPACFKKCVHLRRKAGEEKRMHRAKKKMRKFMLGNTCMLKKNANKKAGQRGECIARYIYIYI